MNSPISSAEVMAALQQWGKGLVSIAEAYANQSDYVAVAEVFLRRCYAFETQQVLFKPTLASKVMFRKTLASALSYYVGGNLPEDRGFALNSWIDVQFDIAGMAVEDEHAIVMGSKILRDKSGQVTTANFTMGFKRDSSQTLKIFLHHSSLPFVPAP